MLRHPRRHGMRPPKGLRQWASSRPRGTAAQGAEHAPMRRSFSQQVLSQEMAPSDGCAAPSVRNELLTFAAAVCCGREQSFPTSLGSSSRASQDADSCTKCARACAAQRGQFRKVAFKAPAAAAPEARMERVGAADSSPGHSRRRAHHRSVAAQRDVNESASRSSSSVRRLEFDRKPPDANDRGRTSKTALLNPTVLNREGWTKRSKSLCLNQLRHLSWCAVMCPSWARTLGSRGSPCGSPARSRS